MTVDEQRKLLDWVERVSPRLAGALGVDAGLTGRLLELALMEFLAEMRNTRTVTPETGRKIA